MRKSSSFLRVFRSYSGLEKIISIILLVGLIFFGGKFVYEKMGFGNASQKEGIYTEGFPANIYSINPVYADLNEPDRDVSKLVFRGLTKYDPETKNIVGDMANVTISEDKLTYTFVLKDNILWHDGELLDAQDVYFTLHDVVQSPEFQNPILKANFEGVEITKVDDRTISFKLSAPNSFFITNTTVGILPEHILMEVPVIELANHEFNQNPVGTGPYMINTPLTTNNKGISQVVLERFDQFYGDIPEIQKVRFYGFPTRTDMVDKRSSLNAMPKLSDEAIAAVSEDSRFSLYGYSLPQYNAVFMNMDNQILKSPKVRQALQKAIFKDDFLEQLPNTIPVETPVLSLNQIEWRYTAGMDEAIKLIEEAGFNEFIEEEVPEEVSEETSEESVAEEDSTTEGEETETEQAEAADEATIEEVTETTEEETEEQPKVRKNAGGKALEFRLITRLYPEGSYKYNETQTVLNYLETNWAKAGVKLNIELYDPTTLQEKITSRDYDMLLFGQSLGYNFDLYGYWHSTQASETGLNLSNYKSFKVDTLIEAIRTTFDPDEKTKNLEELAEVIQADVPAIFLYRPVYYYASDNKVKGIKLEDIAFPADRFCRINEWYF